MYVYFDCGFSIRQYYLTIFANDLTASIRMHLLC